MSDLGIFMFGCCVLGVTLTATLLLFIPGQETEYKQTSRERRSEEHKPQSVS